MERVVVRSFCHNCKKDLIVYREAKGVSKSQCKYCGAVNVSKIMTRRKICIEVIAPFGTEVTL